MVRILNVLFLNLILISLLYNEVQTLRILCVFPMPSISHQVVFRKYTQELAKRGHELVIITPNPHLPKDRPKDNVTEIDVSIGYQILNDLVDNHLKMEMKLKRGVLADVNLMTFESYKLVMNMYTEEFKHPEVQALIKDKNQKFDLIVIEAFLDFHYYITSLYDVPVISFSSFLGTPENYAYMGAVSRHPLLYPNIFRNFFSDLTLIEKIREVYYEWKMYNEMDIKMSNYQNELLKLHFGEDIPTVHDLRKNVDLLFLNSHPVFDNNRPVPPNVIYLGGSLHLQPVEELPKDLKHYLDNSKQGVIYVSLGTNVQTQLMDKEFLDQFLEAFKQLPYNILWKLNDDSLEGVPSNVKIQTWFPQRDILKHPNIKLFIMQGGCQSTDEAMDAGVPLVVIPVLGDQWYNANKFQELGIAESLNSFVMTAQDLVNAVNKVISDNSYRRNIIKLREYIRDQPQTPLEKAVWWTEHLARHGPTKFMRNKAAGMSWPEYLMLDVVFVVSLSTLGAIATVILVTIFVLRKFSNKNSKTKLKKN